MIRQLAAAALVVGGVGVGAAESASAVPLPPQPAVSYPLGHRTTCDLGWVKAIAEQRVKGKERRYVACVLPDETASRSMPALASLPIPAFAGEDDATWSGYVETGAGPYTSVSGQWTEPLLNCSVSANTATVAVWVGIDGTGVPQLIQSGTEIACVDGQQLDYAFFTSDSQNYIPEMRFNVNGGDTIYSRIWEVSPGRWQWVVADLTTGIVATTRHGVAGPARRRLPNGLWKTPASLPSRSRRSGR